MIDIKELKTERDFMKIQIGDKIIIKYMNGKMFFLEITRIGANELAGKPDVSYTYQETIIDVPSLLKRDLGKYIECVVRVS